MNTPETTHLIKPTIFENIWFQSEGHLFKSEQHGVMAVADAFPKLPFQVVVAPQWGDQGGEVKFSDLPRVTKRKMHEVADTVEEKIAEHISPNQRVITHTEGFGVKDHAHIVLFAAERKEGERLYSGNPLGAVAIQNTLEVVTFTPEESELLEARLAEIR